MKYLGLYLLYINIVSVVLCAIDKFKAKAGGWRVSEKTLLSWGLAGGAFCMYITMRLIRHKTLHKKFMIGLPIIIFIQCMVLLGLLYLIHATA